MIVMKFGGTSVGNAERIANVAKIVKSEYGRSPIVVVSAVGGVTDGLIGIAQDAISGKKHAEKLNELIDKHYHIIEELGLDPAIINEEVNHLRKHIDGISLLEELTPKTLDKLMSFGERMSARIVAEYMSSISMPAKSYNSYDLGLLTDSNFGDADVLPEAYPKIRRSLSGKRHIPVVTGFIGKNKEGYITTLGRGGSDYTASILGAAVNAKEIQIWTDVDGIMTTDPKIVKGAKSLDVVSYEEASELAFMGAKVLHPKTILPAINKNIPVRILNTFNPKHHGTYVLKEIKVKSRVASIAYKKKIKVINISTPKMFQAHGFLRRVFEIFDNEGISVDMISTSEVNISVTMDGKQDTDRLIEKLGEMADVEVRANRAKISMVGKGMVYMPGVLGKLFSSLGDINIEMVSSSTSEINQSFVVKEEHADEAVKRLHATFFGR